MCSQNERIPSNDVCKFESSHSAVSAARVGREWRHTRKQTKSGANKRRSQIPIQHANGFTSRLAMKSRCPISTLAVGIASSHSSYAASLGSGRPHCSREASAGWRTAARPIRGRETDCVAGLVGLELANVGSKIAI